MSSILITGVAGFIGRNLASYLAKDGSKVVGCDQVKVSRSFVSEHGLDSFKRIDLVAEDLDEFLIDHNPHILVHAAGPNSVPESIINPLKDFESSVKSLFRVLESIRRVSPATKIVLSSAAVYGNPEKLPIREDHILQPISPYGYHKNICEKILKEFHEIYALKSCFARIFSAYGNGLHRQVLWDICQKALNGSIVELYGTGLETRDFVHVKDVAQAICKIAQNAQFRTETYNIGNGEEITIANLAHQLLLGLHKNCELRFSGTSRKGDPSRWCADINRIEALGYRPSISIERGVKDYARHIRDMALT